MVRQGIRTFTLDKYISSWSRATEKLQGPCKHYAFWKSVMVDEQWLKTIPKDLHQQLQERWWAVNGFRFLDLPFELREMILKFAMGPIAKPFVQTESPHNRLSGRPDMRLALVSKQLREELMPVLTAHTTFCFRNIDVLLDFHHQFQSTFKKIRSIELNLNQHKLLLLFGVCMKFGHGACQYSLPPSASSASFSSICADLPLLRRMRVDIPHIAAGAPNIPRSACQEVYCVVFWAGARQCFRHLPTIDLGGFICDAQKQGFLREHAIEKAGFLPDPDEYRNWQIRTLTQW